MAARYRRELALLALGIGLVAALRRRLPHTVSLGDLLLAGAALLLLQGLVRDVGRLLAARRGGASRQVTCVCLESTLGLASVVAGAALTLGWAPVPFHVGPLFWPVAFGAVGLFGIATSDVVLDWRTFRVRREADHGASVVWRPR